MITLVPDKIDSMFENEDNQYDVWLNLYRFVFPDWDNIKSIAGYPLVSNDTSTYIFERFIAFDKIHHPDVLAGGCWMNKGFSTDSSGKLDDWKVYLDECEIEYHDNH